MAEERPPAVQSMVTGLLGGGVFVVGFMVLPLVTPWTAVPDEWRMVALLAAMFAVMAAFEVLVMRVHRRQFDLSAPRPLDGAAWERVLRRWLAMALSAAVVALFWVVAPIYGVTGEVAHTEEMPYGLAFRMIAVLAGIGLVGSVPYLVACERYGTWDAEHDELLVVADGYEALFRRRRPALAFWGAWRSFAVKGFYLPLMSLALLGQSQTYEDHALRFLHADGSWLDPANTFELYLAAMGAAAGMDVAIATLGYAVSLRVLDTHVRSAEPTLLGWVVCLACYPPFGRLTGGAYLGPVRDNAVWSGWTEAVPWLHAVLACAIVACFTAYMASHACFGLRFSNLTHRGILDRGPYGIVRHPAYVVKNLGWWIASLPFLVSPAAIARLAGWTLLYVARALTEEWHLERFEDYQAYEKRVKWRFIPGVF